ncbi:OmpA family protein [Tamlana fucoidanivorans]|uniref:OmpA family protein n=1 Tax=Allotamlana fucoidanivorans TaxID=2583814 RepID=A0A5C4SEW2_9FLAO|nr:OmpA family protein [Tamlana fucoidanivorans]TNJ41522.1 OmpA family protein [Tamlana fucoidanivorans]
MKIKNYTLTVIVLLLNIVSMAQSGKQKRADNLFNKFAFYDAKEVYKELINKNYNVDYATRRLGDCYAYMRMPDSAVIYYQKAIEQKNVPTEYYYYYAQALRGTENYKASRTWLKRYKKSGGKINKQKFLKDSDFINSIFNTKQHYFLNNAIQFNSEFSDFGAIENNGLIYFASSRDQGVLRKHIYGWNNEPFLDVYVTEKSKNDSVVNHKSKLKGKVNSAFHDGPVTLTKDGNTMYFSRTAFLKNVLSKNNAGVSNLKIYKASLIDGKWTNIEELPFNSNYYSNGHPALNEDESKLYFASDRPNGYGGSDIYYVDILADNSYGTPQNVGYIVNTDKDELFPFINNEGVLFFSSDGHPGLGLLDVFGTVKDKEGQLVSALNLGIPVNSSKDDFSFFMSTDGLSGYFASNRKGGIGSDDIYAFDRIPPLIIEGHIQDELNNLPIEDAQVVLFDNEGNEIVSLKTDEDGYYQVNIDRNSEYKLNASHPKYEQNFLNITSKNLENSVKSIKGDIKLSPIPDVPVLADLGIIYFDFDQSNIRPDAALELDKVVDLMVNTYPEMVIRIESHTDSRGSLEYNDELSGKRAYSTYYYLVSKGIDASRIIEYKGVGERQLTNSCNGTINCTEAEHQLNRRTEFIIIKMK